MPKGTDINQFFDVGFVFKVKDDVLCSFDLGIGEDAFVILMIDITDLIYGQWIFWSSFFLASAEAPLFNPSIIGIEGWFT